MLKEEEILWFQKSRERWITLGDRNTKFFHTSTLIRRNRNKIKCLMDEDGSWVADANRLKDMAVNYFLNLFHLEDESEQIITTPAKFPQWSSTDLNALNRSFSAEDVRRAIFDMSPYKAPGIDGFQPIFFQRMWHVVGPEVVITVLRCLNEGVLPKALNETLIVLVPKVPAPESEVGRISVAVSDDASAVRRMDQVGINSFKSKFA